LQARSFSFNFGTYRRLLSWQTVKLRRTSNKRLRPCGAPDRALPAEIVPDFSVMFLGLLEQPSRGAGNVGYGHIRHGAPKLREGLLFEVEAARVFGRKIRINPQRRGNLAK
jgi:hypothetical protein